MPQNFHLTGIYLHRESTAPHLLTLRILIEEDVSCQEGDAETVYRFLPLWQDFSLPALTQLLQRHPL